VKSSKKDEISIGPEVAPGVRIALRKQDDEVKEVLVREAKEGQPMQPGLELAHVGDASCECGDGHWRELTSIYKSEGPAQVATPAYREGYDRIWGKQKVAGA